MKKEQKNVSLATEIIGDLQDVVSTTLSEIEALTLDLDMAEFILNELLELTDKEPENELEALRFAQNQHRIYKYADIARDYVGRVSSDLYDLKITIRKKKIMRKWRAKKMIDIRKIEPVDLPTDLIYRLGKVHHTALRDFVMMIDKKNWIMYVNASVPDEDMQRFIDYIYYPGEYVVMDNEELINRITAKYGDYIHEELFDGYKHLNIQRRESRAEKIAKIAIPMIEKEIQSEKPVIEYDERLLGKVFKAGYEPYSRKTPENITNYGCVYLFYLGYLMGAGMIED